MGSMTLDAKNRAAEIRAWAGQNGFDISQRGAIPKGIVAAWESATGHAPGDGDSDSEEDGPDWDSAAAELIADPGEPDPPPAASREQPVSSLDEARERIGSRNRQPAWAREGGKRTRARPAAEPKMKVTAAIKADVEAKLVLVLGLVGVPWKAADPYCGGQWCDDVESMAKAWAPLLCQSAEVVRFFTRTSTFMLWVAALASMQNVASCVFSHHIAQTVEIRDDGAVVDKRKDAHGHPSQQVVQPAVEDFSLYTVSGHAPQARAAGGERVYPSS